jgi:serine protease inhibitor
MKQQIFLAAFLVWFAGMSPSSAAPDDERNLATANNGFAFNLLKQLAKDQPAKNIFISPYSASTVLQMVLNGAAGQTKTEMQRVLGTQNLSANSVNSANKTIGSSLNNLNTNVVLTTANAIWYKRGNDVKPDFLALNSQFFGSAIEPLDFGDPHAVDVINAWANDKTHGRIPQIADGMIDPVYSRLFLANAVYFKGKWSDPFKPEETKDWRFHFRDGSKKDIPMMTQSKTFTYRHGTGYQAVRLPYEGENLAMYVFLPDLNSSPEQLLGILDGDRWQHVTKPGFSQNLGMLVLPKFKLEYSVELSQTLKTMGMKTAFDMQKADFSKMGEQLYISGALQKTFVEVKEEGTEAAAVTGIDVASASFDPTPRPEPFEMIVDRPFLFLIEDNQTGTILFMGLIFDPHSD